jgi:hypothetical protein
MCANAAGGKHAPTALDAAVAKSTTKIRTTNLRDFVRKIHRTIASSKAINFFLDLRDRM